VGGDFTRTEDLQTKNKSPAGNEVICAFRQNEVEESIEIYGEF
jgi:hypothetical protein